MQHLISRNLLLATLAACALPSLGICNGGDRLYTVNSSDPNIRRVDPLTMTTKATVLMSAAGYTIKYANGLALNPVTGKLFVLCTVTGTSARLLGTVDPGTGTVTPIGSTGQQFAGLAFDWAGNLYGVTGDGATTPSTLYSLSTTTGTPTFIKSFTNPDYGETITFDPLTGLILHASGDTNQVFESLHPTTLALTNIPLTGDKIGEMLSIVHVAGATSCRSTSTTTCSCSTPTGSRAWWATWTTATSRGSRSPSRRRPAATSTSTATASRRPGATSRPCSPRAIRPGPARFRSAC
jgi:hypothetical protein